MNHRPTPKKNHKLLIERQKRDIFIAENNKITQITSETFQAAFSLLASLSRAARFKKSSRAAPTQSRVATKKVFFLEFSSLIVWGATEQRNFKLKFISSHTARRFYGFLIESLHLSADAKQLESFSRPHPSYDLIRKLTCNPYRQDSADYIRRLVASKTSDRDRRAADCCPGTGPS